MICSLLSINMAKLYSEPIFLSHKDRDKLISMIDRRNKGEPLAYILGSIGFWEIDIEVNTNVLVPRPETESLVELILEECRQEKLSILDLGTGSGAIALALCYEREKWDIFASDISEGALSLANKNRIKLDLPVCLVRADWLEAFAHNCFDLVISNPPYMDKNNKLLKSDGLRYEPTSSLVSGKGGLFDLEKVVSTGFPKLKKNGYLFVEHAPEQTKLVKEYFYKADFSEIKVYKDLNGDSRFTRGQK